MTTAPEDSITCLPASLISQSHIGHFLFFMPLPLCLLTCRAPISVRNARSLAQTSVGDFQIPAHFTETAARLLAANRRRQAERATERIRKVAVAGKAKIQRKPGKVVGAGVDAIERGVETQAVSILMNAQSSLAAENAAQMKRRTVY